MKIDTSEHTKHPWRSHELMADFEIEDVWRLPVHLKPGHSLNDFLDQFKAMMETSMQTGPAGALFRLRMFLGRIFGWDKRAARNPLLRSGSIRERYARAENLKGEQLPPPGEDDFVPVYLLEAESLSEIENSTVHAGMHMARVPRDGGDFTIQMTVYVKPKGLLGRFYMALIKPFRLLIVYPAMMKMIARQWENYTAR